MCVRQAVWPAIPCHGARTGDGHGNSAGTRSGCEPEEAARDLGRCRRPSSTSPRAGPSDRPLEQIAAGRAPPPPAPPGSRPHRGGPRRRLRARREQRTVAQDLARRLLRPHTPAPRARPRFRPHLRPYGPGYRPARWGPAAHRRGRNDLGRDPAHERETSRDAAGADGPDRERHARPAGWASPNRSLGVVHDDRGAPADTTSARHRDPFGAGEWVADYQTPERTPVPMTTPASMSWHMGRRQAPPSSSPPPGGHRLPARTLTMVSGWLSPYLTHRPDLHQSLLTPSVALRDGGRDSARRPSARTTPPPPPPPLPPSSLTSSNRRPPGTLLRGAAPAAGALPARRDPRAPPPTSAACSPT